MCYNSNSDVYEAKDFRRKGSLFLMKNHFYQIPDEIMCRKDISATDKLLYGVIKRLKVCFASKARLAKILLCVIIVRSESYSIFSQKRVASARKNKSS